MILIIHISLALTSVICTAGALARPSLGVIRLSYGLIGGTLASGAIMVVMGGSLMSFCVSGMIFTIGTVGMARLASRRLVSMRA